MTSIQTLKDILDWKLLQGSHTWPGPSGGTCINEAAIVVAGLPYKKVQGANSLPPCFSKVIGSYLIILNDYMEDSSRQRLIEFAPLLSGSADNKDVEEKRLDYIATETSQKIIVPTLMKIGEKEKAEKFMTYKFSYENLENTFCNILRCDSIPRLSVLIHPRPVVLAFAANKSKFCLVVKNLKDEIKIDDICIDIVRGALAIGNKANPIDTGLIQERAAFYKQDINQVTV